MAREGVYVSGYSNDFSNEVMPSIAYYVPPGTTSASTCIAWEIDGEIHRTSYVDLDLTTWSYTYDSTILTDADIESIMTTDPYHREVPVIFSVTSLVNGRWYIEDTPGKMKITSLDQRPVITSIAVIDTNPVTRAIMGEPEPGESSDIIVGLSTIDVKMSANGTYGALLESVNIRYPGINSSAINQQWYTETFSDPPASLTDYVMTMNQSSIHPMTIDTGDDTYFIKLRDTRLNILDYSFTPNLFAWFTPYAETKIERLDGFYTQTSITVNCTYAKFPDSNDNPRNEITIYCLYKKTSDADYDPSTRTTLYDGTAATLQLDNSYSWNVLVAIKDKLSNWVSYEYTVSAGKPILFIDKKRHSVGINCLPQHNNDLEVNGIPIGNAASITQVTLTQNVTIQTPDASGYFQLDDDLDYPDPNAVLIGMQVYCSSIAATSGTIYSLVQWADGQKPYIMYQHASVNFQNVSHSFIFTFFVP